MDEATLVLRAVYDELNRAPEAERGQLTLNGSVLSALDGKIRLTVNVRTEPDAHPSIAHCHVVAEIGSFRSGNLDACIVGIDADRADSLSDAAKIWVDLVAGPIFSLVHAKPVMGAEHFDGSDLLGVAGCHGFVGPIASRASETPIDLDAVAQTQLFDYASAMAPPGVVHLAKVTLNATASGWTRSLEVDGHAASHADSPWLALPESPATGVVTQFAVFHFANERDTVSKRQQLDDAIRRFVAAFAVTNNAGAAADEIVNEGGNGEFGHRIYAFACHDRR